MPSPLNLLNIPNSSRWNFLISVSLLCTTSENAKMPGTKITHPQLRQWISTRLLDFSYNLYLSRKSWVCEPDSSGPCPPFLIQSPLVRSLIRRSSLYCSLSCARTRLAPLRFVCLFVRRRIMEKTTLRIYMNLVEESLEFWAACLVYKWNSINQSRNFLWAKLSQLYTSKSSCLSSNHRMLDRNEQKLLFFSFASSVLLPSRFYRRDVCYGWMCSFFRGGNLQSINII